MEGFWKDKCSEEDLKTCEERLGTLLREIQGRDFKTEKVSAFQQFFI